MNFTFTITSYTDLRAFINFSLYALLVFIPQFALGETYYLDGLSGNDSSPGTSSRSPWKTLSRIQSQTIKPGDTILLKRGRLWREQLSITSSGTSKKRITFGAYGSGPKPIIIGSEEVTGWVQDGTLFKASVSAEPANIYVDNSIEPLDRKSDRASLEDSSSGWFFDGTDLYIRLLNDSNPSTHSIEASVRDYGIYSANHGYITIENLDVRYTRQSGVYFEDTTTTVANEFNTISHVNARNCTEGGIYVHGMRFGSPQPLRGWKIIENTIGRIDAPNTLDYDRAGIIVRGTVDALIKGNSVATTNKFGITARDDFGGQKCRHPTVTQNLLGNNNGNISIASCPEAVVTYNKISKSTGYGIGIGPSGLDNYETSDNVLIAYNVIDDVDIAADQILYNGIDINGGSKNGKAYNNTVRHVAISSITLEGDNNEPSSGWYVSNNIFDCRDNRKVTGENPCVYVTQNVIDATFSNNLFVTNETDFPRQFQHPLGVYKDILSFSEDFPNVNSIRASSIRYGRNLSLTKKSLARDSGKKLASKYALGLHPGSRWPTKIRLVNQKSFGKKWDRGAFVYINR